MNGFFCWLELQVNGFDSMVQLKSFELKFDFICILNNGLRIVRLM